MKKWLWILFGGMVCLGAAFWYLNFHIGASNTKSVKNINTASIGIEDSLPDAMQRGARINLVLVGDEFLIAALQKALAAEMNDAGIANVELVQGSAPKYQSPVLVVKVGSADLFWTPFFATSQLTIQAGYSSNGDTIVIEGTPITLSSEDGMTLNMYGEYRVSDRSWGLISRRGYHQILADYLAREIVTILKYLYRVSISRVPFETE